MMFNPDLPNLPGDDTIQVNYSITLLNREVANLTLTPATSLAYHNDIIFKGNSSYLA